ncbi:MAG: hypothetical protein HY738_14920 [Bacteroidia bacterium]|nr:hypothetical protein [Bacteroidia bacterium]
MYHKKSDNYSAGIFTIYKTSSCNYSAPYFLPQITQININLDAFLYYRVAYLAFSDALLINGYLLPTFLFFQIAFDIPLINIVLMAPEVILHWHL